MVHGTSHLGCGLSIHHANEYWIAVLALPVEWDFEVKQVNLYSLEALGSRQEHTNSHSTMYGPGQDAIRVETYSQQGELCW